MAPVTGAQWRVGARGVPRTGATSLTDDELVLCDAIFKVPTSKALVLCEDFSMAFNLPYDLECDATKERAAVLQRMLQQGLIRETGDETDPFGPCVAMTDVGGGLWERERLPVWLAYCWDSSIRTMDGSELVISALHREVGDAFLRVAIDCGLYRAADGPRRVSVEDEVQVVPWRRMRLTRVSVPLAEERSPRTDWELYESQRIWWRSAPELLQSHRVLERSPFGPPWPPALYGT